MNLVFSRDSWEEYLYWQETDPQTLKRINLLVKEMMRDPYRGIGKPEPLRHGFQGYWSRRITGEHRIVYRVSGSELWIAQLRSTIDATAPGSPPSLMLLSEFT